MAINDEIPKSRLTMTYRTKVDGEKETVSLPLRLLVMGDLSNGSSTDRQVDLDQRELRNLDGTNLESVMADMNMSMSFSVPNKIDPDKGEDLDVTLPVTSMKSFEPAELAQHIPKLKSLLLLRKLLLEVQGNLDNRKDFRKLIRALAQDENAVQSLLGELEGYESFKLPNQGNA
ncbi:MAG: type VI secretion system contractile sheath small subunit [Myxococcota bacterium]|nr:type VI secretion system contractile sheath small subunit [Myxococcota bacterium]